MNYIHILALFIAFQITTNRETDAKEPEIFKNEKFAFGLNIGMTANWHIANFYSFQGAADCGVFKKGFSTGLAATVTGEIPITQSAHLCLGLGYMNRNAEMANRTTYPVLDPETQKPVDLRTENNLWADLGYMEIIPEIRTIIPLDFVPLRFSGGFRYGIPVKSYFIQKEKVLNEEYNLVVDNKRIKERTIASGQIKTISNPSYGVSFGLETLLRAGKTTFLTQKAVIDWNLNNIASDVTWKALSLRIELGIRFGFNGREGAITDPPPAPIPNKPSVATETADIRPVDKELKLKCRIDSIEGVINTGEEFLASLPLVNCVFFDRNSAEIGDYYAKEADERLLFFTGNAVEMHKYILVQISNIIKNNPEARIILKGATSGKENEDGGRLLAKSRAESVRDALAELGVNTGMIEINYDEMPETPSNQDYKEGLAENQRVDIIVKNAALQEYVSIQKYAEFEGRVSAYVDFENTDSIVVLKNGTSSQNQICKSSGIYFVPVRKRISRPGEDVAISLTLVSGKYETIDEKRFPTPALKKIPLELNLRAFDAVIRFDYNSSKLSEENKRLLKQMSDFLPGGSEILIYGSSDALGTEKRNVQLSGERAKMAEEYIRSVSGRKFIIRTEINTDKFPEDTPQGRFLNRSIRIRVGIKN